MLERVKRAMRALCPTASVATGSTKCRTAADALHRQDAQVDGEDEDQEQAQREGGNRIEEDSDHDAQVIDPGALIDGGHDADEQTQTRADRDAKEGQSSCERKSFGDDAQDWLAELDRTPQVAADEVAQEDEVLLEDGSVQAQVFADLLNELGRGAVASHDFGRIAGQGDAQHDKDDGCHGEDKREGDENAAQDVFAQATSVPHPPRPLPHYGRGETKSTELGCLRQIST